MAQLQIEPAHWYTRRSTRRAHVIRDATAILTRHIPDDPEFVECYARTSPTVTRVQIEEGTIVTEDELVAEAVALRDALGTSEEALHPTRDESKYREAFSFQHAVHPVMDGVIGADREMNHKPFVTAEGPLPTFFQFQRQELVNILEHYARSHGSIVHGPDHICRSLILAMAMAKCLMMHGQTVYRPRDTHPNADATNDAERVQRERAARAELRAPFDDEVDLATIFFAVAFHDSGRKADGRDVWEHESARNAYYYMRELGYSIEYAANVAKIIVKNEETNSGRPDNLRVSRTSVEVAEGTEYRNAAREDPAPLPEERPLSINEIIVHDADTLEIMRVLFLRDQAFDRERFLYLNHRDFLSGFYIESTQAARLELIRDAEDLCQLTRVVLAPTRRDEERRDVAPRFVGFTGNGRNHGGFEPMMKAFERYIIDAIFADRNAYPFLYKYYFESCFNPACPELARLTSEQRLAVIRARLHARERSPRDRQWAERTVTTFNQADGRNGNYVLDTVSRALVSARLTMNLTHATLNVIVRSLANDPPPDPMYKQYWEVIWFPGRARDGGGAADDPATRDDAERRKLNYETWHTDPEFRRAEAPRPWPRGGPRPPRARRRCFDRPNYAGVNAARIAPGAVTKYGTCAVYLHDRVRPRVTYTFRDTFGSAVMPDHVATSEEPGALLRQIDGISGMDPDFLQCVGSRHGWDRSDHAARLLGFNRKLNPFMYVEAHVHGPISWRDDVDAIVIEVTTNPVIDPGIEAFCEQYNIRLGFAVKGYDHVFVNRGDALALSQLVSPDLQRPEPPVPVVEHSRRASVPTRVAGDTPAAARPRANSTGRTDGREAPMLDLFS